MRRYWLDASAKSGDEIQIEGDAFHHIFDVCRQSEGSKFEVLFEDGKAYLVQVSRVGKKLAVADILESRTVAPLRDPKITLCMSIPRFAVFDAVIEKAVELGVFAIQPFYSDFSFIKESEKVSENRIERWKKIVVSATQQSGRGERMVVHEPLRLNSILKDINQKPDRKGLLLYEGLGQMDIRAWAEATRREHPRLKELSIFVGSEGGFSANEIKSFQDVSLIPVTLGEQVLRVETACVASVSVLKYEWGLMGPAQY